MSILHSKPSVAVSIVFLFVLVFIGGSSLIGGKSSVPNTSITVNDTSPITPFPSGNFPLQMKTFYPPTSSPPSVSQSQIPAVSPIVSPLVFKSGTKLGWSSGYYPGWLQSTYPPQTLPWKGLTYLIQFSIMSNSDGSLQTTAHSLTPAFMQEAVTEGHKHNVRVLLSIGGDDDNNFAGACSSANRARFVANLVTIMQTYGYDGIDLDIERDFGYPAHADYIACVQSLRTALDAISPRPTLSMAADPSWQAYMVSQVAQYADQINLMSYRTDVSGIGAELNNYTSHGIPKSKLGIGLGVGAGGIDNDALHCNGKANYAVSNAYGGIMEFVITEDMANHSGQTPCFDAIAPYL
jgi:hypothetical protein